MLRAVRHGHGTALALVGGSILAAALLGGTAAAASAQVVSGRVIDASSGEGVATAGVVLLDSLSQPVAAATADSVGGFVLEAPAAGAYRLRASRIGYKEVTTKPVDLADDQFLSVELRLSTEAVLIDALTVNVRRTRFDRDIAGFSARKREGFGHFVTPNVIQRLHLSRASNYVQRVSGVHVRYGSGGRSIVTLTHLDITCVPNLMIDGTPAQLDESMSIDDYVQPQEVYAIEVYTNPRHVPHWVSGFHPGCGAIVIWTNRGRRTR